MGIAQPDTSQCLVYGTNIFDVLNSVSSQAFKQSQQTQSPGILAKDMANKEALSLVGAQRKEILEPRFRELVTEWKNDRRSTSFVRDLISHPAYLGIIGMGPDALPLILGELDTELDHWFVALKSISGQDPVSAESKGNMTEMRKAWLKWGHDQGYTR